ncbi:hypothetical protein LSM04_003997 [Trypanosoma melophagium]|uniref:uncharacterized protein n=1 Tax=Trypanosoma melophagium TaxID=715481 RepID=UPI00351A5888|nr:hypothetical protein LSM04_003997 [Trypanosoma melophagium]
MNHHKTTCGILAVSDLTSSTRETVMEYIVNQLLVGETSPLVRSEGSLFTLRVEMPTRLLDKVLPEWRISARLKHEGSDEKITLQRSSSLSSSSINLKRNDVRDIKWLRKIMHEFFFDTIRRIEAPDTNCDNATSVLLNDSLEKEDGRKQKRGKGNSNDDNNGFPLQSPSFVERVFSPLDIRAVLLNFLMLKCGETTFVRQIGVDLLRAIQHHRNWDLETMIFSALLSCSKYDELDVRLFLKWWAELHSLSHSGDADSRFIHSGELWSIIIRCISICSLPHEIKKSVSNRVKHTLLRWFNSDTAINGYNTERSSKGEKNLNLPKINGMPNFFSLPYSVAALQGYLGVSNPVDDAEILAFQGTSKQIVPDAHVLALLLINTKVERLQHLFSLSTSLTLTREMDYRMKTPIAEKLTETLPVFSAVNSSSDTVKCIPLYEKNDETEKSSIIDVEVEVMEINSYPDEVSNNKEEHHVTGMSTQSVSLRDRELRFKKEMESLEERMTKTMEIHHKVCDK